MAGEAQDKLDQPLDERAQVLPSQEVTALGSLAAENAAEHAEAVTGVQATATPEQQPAGDEAETPFYKRQMGRGDALLWLANVGMQTAIVTTGIGLALKTAPVVMNRVSQGKQLLTLRDQFNELIASLKKPEQLVAEAAASATMPYIDLRNFTGKGPVKFHVGLAGMSSSYWCGTKNDKNNADPFDQPHSIMQVAYEMVDDDGLSRIGIAHVLVGTWSVPGAPTTPGFQNDPDKEPRLYGINGPEQLESTSIRKHLAQSGPSVLGQLAIEGGGLNNIRGIVTGAAQFMHTVSNLTNALLSNDHAARDTQEQYETVIGLVDDTAAAYYNDLMVSAAKASDLNDENIANGGYGVVLSVAGMPRIQGLYQPFGLIDEDNNNPLLKPILIRDVVDLKFTNRYCLRLQAIPQGLGYQFGDLYFTRMREQQHRAQRDIPHKHPRLQTTAPEFMGVNDTQMWFRITREDGAVFDWGDGHPGDEGIIANGVIWLDGVRGGEPEQEAIPLSSLARQPITRVR